MEPENQPTNPNPQPMEKPVKKCKHMPIIIILAILAIGGIGFGGYELWQNMQKDDEIKNLQAEKGEEQKDKEKVETSEEQDNTSNEYENNSEDRKLNPIISSSKQDQIFSLANNFHIYDYDTGDTYSLYIGLKNGDISGCGLYSVVDNTSSLQRNCEIINIPGKIYKVDYLGYGQMGNPTVVFIMQNGTVNYFNLDDALASSSINVKPLEVNGFVVDAIREIEVMTVYSGYMTSALVYSDGTYEIYESLFKQ